jgi:hypothetical protein
MRNQSQRSASPVFFTATATSRWCGQHNKGHIIHMSDRQANGDCHHLPASRWCGPTTQKAAAHQMNTPFRYAAGDSQAWIWMHPRLPRGSVRLLSPLSIPSAQSHLYKWQVGSKHLWRRHCLTMSGSGLLIAHPFPDVDSHSDRIGHVR